jgi:uncharacterized membrane protein
MNLIVETKYRSLIKAIVWRFIAFINSWIILHMAFSESAFNTALIMNLTGLIFFYIYERVWNTIQVGRYIK